MDFYRELKTKLDQGDRKMRAALILTGERAGEKALLGAEGPQALAEKLDSRETGQFLCESGQALPENERIFVETIGGSPKMIICGGGHVSMPVIALARMVGFRVTVLEDRPKFADMARGAGADRVICAPFEESLAGETLDGDTYVVIVTRGHRYDAACLHSVLGREETCAYVGMMGSRRRTAIVKEQMAEMGIGQERIDSVHTPIGLAIKAETPEEIAVSILAEIIEVKNSRQKRGAYPAEILDGILEAKDKGRPFVLATIVTRKGSAPRSVGTKMLIFPDGQQIGTIGGGCAESEILQKARLMLMETDTSFRLVTVDMTARQAEEEGMVCGGTIEVALERG